jgi:hypothetical protein
MSVAKGPGTQRDTHVPAVSTQPVSKGVALPFSRQPQSSC